MTTTALEIGKAISQLVTGYRDFVHALVNLVHLPQLPSTVYDVLGVVAFSIGRGIWVGAKVDKAVVQSLRLLFGT